MAESLSVDVRASLAWLFQDVLTLSTVADVAQLEYAASLGGAPTNDAVNLLWHDERTVGAYGSDTLTLSALPKTLFGQEVLFRFAQIKGLLLVNLSTDPAGPPLWIGGAESAPWSAPFFAADDQVALPADSCLLWVNKKAGWDVAADTSDALRIKNLGGSPVNYRIVLLGVAA